MSANLVRRQFVDAEYGQVHLRVAGQASDKPALICLHMVPKSGRSFQKLMPYLATDRLVLAPDYPGYGESDHPPVSPHIKVEDYARSVWQVADAMGVQQVDFVGYHTGAMVAVEAASVRSQQVNKIVQLSAPVFTEQEVADFHRYYAPVPLDEQGKRFIQMWERILHYRGPGMTLEMCATSLAENLRGGEAYESGHRAAFNYARQYQQKLRQLQQEILVLNLNDDLHEHSKRVDTMLNHGQRIDCMDWGAGFLDIWPQQVANRMHEFFTDQKAGN